MTPPTLTAPPRAKRRTGKLAPITRSQAAAFNAAVMALMARYPVFADLRGNKVAGFVSWRIPAPIGTVTVALYPRHRDAFEVTLMVPRRLAPEVRAGSGAWHVERPQAEEALTELRTKLAACGVTAT